MYEQHCAYMLCVTTDQALWQHSLVLKLGVHLSIKLKIILLDLGALVASDKIHIQRATVWIFVCQSHFIQLAFFHSPTNYSSSPHIGKLQSPPLPEGLTCVAWLCAETQNSSYCGSELDKRKVGLKLVTEQFVAFLWLMQTFSMNSKPSSGHLFWKWIVFCSVSEERFISQGILSV